MEIDVTGGDSFRKGLSLYFHILQQNGDGRQANNQK